MKTKIYKQNERGTADHGWLKANFSFSFANYFNPEKVNFGALRVLNDDFIAGGMGFGAHSHDNMEIISIPLKGTMKHRDSMSNKWILLHTGEVQIMSAGKGLQHSEMNNSSTEEVNMFQIWIFPNEQDVAPRYDQQIFNIEERKNKLQILVSSITNKVEGSLTIHQNAQIGRIDLDENFKFIYHLKSKSNGVYIMVIEGEINVESILLGKRDAIGIEQANEVNIVSTTKAQVLIIEIPMQY